MIAIPWYFAQRGMMFEFGLVYLFTNIISMFWVPLSGTIIDNYDRKKIFMSITLIGGILIGIIALTGMRMGALPITLISSVFLFTFLNYNIHYPNLQAFVQEITERKNYAKMTSLLEVIGQMTTVTACACATILLEGTQNGTLSVLGLNLNMGVDIQAWKIHEIFLLDAGTYFLSFIIIAMIRYVPISSRKMEAGSILERLKTGWTYLNTHKSIFWYGVLSYTVFVAMLLEAFYLGATYVNNHLREGGDIYANSKMAYAIGAIFTGFTLKYLFTRFSLPLITIILTGFTAVVFLTQFLSHSVILFFAMLFCLGITNAGTRITRVTYLFRNVPNQYFGRSSSIFFLTNILIRIILLALFALKFFHTDNNIIYAYLTVSVILFVATVLLMYKYRSFDLSLKS